MAPTRTKSCQSSQVMRRIIAMRAGWDDRPIKLTLSAFNYPELPPPIRRGRGGLRRLGSKCRVQQVADSPIHENIYKIKGSVCVTSSSIAITCARCLI
jgi:hypothetical protein